MQNHLTLKNTCVAIIYPSTYTYFGYCIPLVVRFQYPLNQRYTKPADVRRYMRLNKLS